MKKIKVQTESNHYPVYIGNKSLIQLADDINKYPVSKCLFVVDENVDKYHSSLIKKLSALIDAKNFKYLFKATEKNKNLNQVEKIYKFLINNNFNRDSSIISIGGGITGDLASFSASTYMRGINFFQVPTTLLSMVDSSVGGKTGVNFGSRKNIIGTFYQPKGVYIFNNFLSTLPKSEIISGAGEILKYAFLADEKNYLLIKDSLKKIFMGDIYNFDRTISSCLNIKSNIVAVDEKETTGLRKILNLGHTFAHAFESASNFRLKHGEAVIGGIYSALFLSEKSGYLDKNLLTKFISDFNFIKPNKILKKLDLEVIYDLMNSDKKNTGGKIRFVLLQDIGNVIVDVSIDKKNVLSSMRKMKSII
jgi:3-dehydroquinate synthase